MRMLRSLLLCCCAGAGIAADLVATLPPAAREDAQALAARIDALLRPSRVTLPGGRASLAAVLAALQASGNQVLAAPDCDLRQEADLGGGTLSFWEAVALVCESMQLEAQPASGLGRILAPQADFAPIAIAGGPLVLRPQRPGSPPLLASEAFAVRLEELEWSHARNPAGFAVTTLSARMSLRCEPRFPVEGLAGALLGWGQLSGEDGQTARIDDAVQEGEWGAAAPAGIACQALWPGRLWPSAGIGAELRLRWCAPVDIQGDLEPGRQSPAMVPGGLMQAWIEEEGGGRSLRMRFPPGSLQMPLELIEPQAEGERGQLLPAQTGIGECSMALPAAAGPQHVRATAQVLIAERSLPLRLSIPLERIAQRQRSQAPWPAIPPRVAWPAGRIALAGAMARLGPGASLVLGVDERREAEVAAVDGPWWEGLVEICRAFGLGVLEDAGGEPGANPFSGGHVSLAHGAGVPAERLKACGAFLVETRALDEERRVDLEGASRTIRLEWRIRLDPALDESACSDGFVEWGAPLRASPDAESVLRIDLAEGQAMPELCGSLRLQWAPWRSEAVVVAPGLPAVLDGEPPLRIVLREAAEAAVLGQKPGLWIEGRQPGPDSGPELRDAEGRVLAFDGEAQEHEAGSRVRCIWEGARSFQGVVRWRPGGRECLQPLRLALPR